MAMLFSTLGGVLAGIMMRRIKPDIPTILFLMLLFCLDNCPDGPFFPRSLFAFRCLAQSLVGIVRPDMAMAMKTDGFRVKESCNMGSEGRGLLNLSRLIIDILGIQGAFVADMFYGKRVGNSLFHVNLTLALHWGEWGLLVYK